MAGTLPPMLQVMRDIGGIDIPESLAKLAGEDGLVETGRVKVEENGATPTRS
jgi:flotillin